MLRSYKEIVYGVLFGLGAALLDVAMDANSEGRSIGGEIASHPAMLFYRLLFVAFGAFLGWLLWKNNTRERNVRHLVELTDRFFREYEAQAVVLHTQVQLLLTKNPSLSSDAEAVLRTIYEKSRDLQSMSKQRPALDPLL
jgi:hypothetical protein